MKVFVNFFPSPYASGIYTLFCLLALSLSISAQNIVLSADRLWDGETMRDKWAVRITNDTIAEIGPLSGWSEKPDDIVYEFSNATILPGLIEAHSHMFLHPYNETSWDDQVLRESVAERSIRASRHAEETLRAGFTTSRDLGSEGAGYADVGLKKAIEKGVIKGPRLFVAGPAIVATGSYGPKAFGEHVRVPLGAIEADGYDALIAEVRRQIGGGADFIKVYADYRWGPDGEARPTFSLEELELIVRTAESSGRYVVAHASTAEAMRRAALAGVRSIEHGDQGTVEAFSLMADRGIALCPTLAAGDAIMQYRGWRKGVEEEPERIRQKRESFRLALQSGVPIMAGGDVGVFPHGDNLRELEMMVEYGMKANDVLRSATSLNASLMGKGDELGKLSRGFKADIIVVEGNPLVHISDLRKIRMVLQGGKMLE